MAETLRTFADLGKLLPPTPPIPLGLSGSTKAKNYLLTRAENSDLTAKELAAAAGITIGSASGLLFKLKEVGAAEKVAKRDGQVVFAIDVEKVREYNARRTSSFGSYKGKEGHSKRMDDSDLPELPCPPAPVNTKSGAVALMLRAIEDIQSAIGKVDSLCVLSAYSTDDLLAELKRRTHE